MLIPLILIGLFFISSCSTESEIEVQNHLPRIDEILIEPATVMVSDTVTFTALVNDEDGDSLYYYWTSTNGQIDYTNNIATWFSPDTNIRQRITCFVSDSLSGEDNNTVTIKVYDQSQLVLIGKWEWVYSIGSWVPDTVTPGNSGISQEYIFTYDSLRYYIGYHYPQWDPDTTFITNGTYLINNQLPSAELKLKLIFENGIVVRRPSYFNGVDTMIFDERAWDGDYSVFIKNN